MIALLCAVAAESDLLLSKLEGRKQLTCGYLPVYRGKIGCNQVIVVTTGIGKSAAAAATAMVIQQFSPRTVLQFGCGGAYSNSDLNIGDIASASAETFGDEGVITPDGFLDMEQMGLAVITRGNRCWYNTFPTCTHLQHRLRPLLEGYAATVNIGYRSGTFVTVSTCSGRNDYGQQLQQRSGGIVENMEGAAVAQICTAADIPFAEIRAISNMVEDRDTSCWQIPAAMQQAQRAVLYIMQQCDMEEISSL